MSGFTKGELNMYKQNIVLGVVPTKRGFLSMEEAARQKDMFMAQIRKIKPGIVTLVDIDDICENGIAFENDKVPQVVQKMKSHGIDALFTPFCDFGEESVVAEVSAALRVPHLVWGARDETPNTDTVRGRDTQCGMFAATKVLRRFGITYSYIYNVPADSDDFRDGYLNFIRVVSVLKDLKNLRIAKIGERPAPFMSVMNNDAALIKRFGIVTVPISPIVIAADMEKLLREDGEELGAYFEDMKKRFDCSEMEEANVKKIAAVKLSVQRNMEKNNCTAAAIECWPSCNAALGVPVCTVLGELADCGLPVSCETDVCGAVTMAIMRACQLGEDTGFLADLTIRHPENDNAELLWHCGPFAYSLKAPESKARMVGGQERFELRQGDLTVCRFDEIDGEYYLFAGEGKTTTGPETNGTYVWFETDDWKRWEEKLMFGPYIHHLGGTYGKFMPVLREVARYLDLNFDTVESDGPRSL